MKEVTCHRSNLHFSPYDLNGCFGAVDEKRPAVETVDLLTHRSVTRTEPGSPSTTDDHAKLQVNRADHHRPTSESERFDLSGPTVLTETWQHGNLLSQRTTVTIVLVKPLTVLNNLKNITRLGSQETDTLSPSLFLYFVYLDLSPHLGISNSELSSDLIVRFSSSLTQGRCGAQDAKRWEGQEKQSNYKRCNTRHKSGKTPQLCGARKRDKTARTKRQEGRC
ncbi:hypothetical protein RRG08_064850 [Elysia crispata]|uniref:Uncharacterized protein n=1 Tax=Elysia crispata TaxID=231223 RepID=A0AAE1A3Z3_9GAST|nr:hypothetical protein RRG08_064850 [Elysia crispata]